MLYEHNGSQETPKQQERIEVATASGDLQRQEAASTRVYCVLCKGTGVTYGYHGEEARDIDGRYPCLCAECRYIKFDTTLAIEIWNRQIKGIKRRGISRNY